LDRKQQLNNKSAKLYDVTLDNKADIFCTARTPVTNNNNSDRSHIITLLSMVKTDQQHYQFQIYTCVPKNRTTKLIVVTLSNLNRFWKLFHC